MDYFPIFLDINSKPCLVVGGGAVAERKTASLLKSGADVTLVAPELTASLRAWRDAGQLTHLNRGFEEADIEEVYLHTDHDLRTFYDDFGFKAYDGLTMRIESRGDGGL